MKAVFLFRGEKITLDVPLYLYFINGLTNRICILDEGDMSDEVEEAYDYLEEELRCIFADNQGEVTPCTISLCFLNPTTEEEKEFGSLIEINSDTDEE